MVDLSANLRQFRAGEAYVYTFKDRVPKTARMFMIEIDRLTTDRLADSIFTGHVLIQTFFSDDGEKWIDGPWSGHDGGVAEEATEKGTFERRTSGNAFSLKRRAGMLMQVRVTCREAQKIPEPRMYFWTGAP